STASVNRCSRFQRSPSGSRTGRFGKRCSSSSVTRPPSRRPSTTRPLDAPRSIAAYSVKVEDLLQPVEGQRSLEERGHLGLPARVDLRRFHRALCRLEVLGLAVADQHAVLAQEERVVGPAGLAERREHLGPDGPMTLAVLAETIRAHPELEADTFHRGAVSDLEVE